MQRTRQCVRLLLACVLTLSLAWTQKLKPDLITPSGQTLYVVGYAHLDTQWRWEFPQTISEYLLKTMRVNFDYIEKYPHYIFNWTGANRYRLMKEYFPSDYERVKQYVAAGRWYPAGSSMEEGDVNAPSAESIIRQILYGNTYFRKEFGKASAEYMLPDCFGFPASLPSILAHAGVKGFSTQKLSSVWQPAPRVGGPGSSEETPEGIPFNVGIWEGPDGETVLAALNPLSYGSNVTYDLSKNPPAATGLGARYEDWAKRVQINGKVSGLFTDYHYVGTGDTGGAPNEASVKLMEAIVTRGTGVVLPAEQSVARGQGQPGLSPPAPVPVGDGPLHVEWSAADQMFLDILKTSHTQALPRYKGDLELINHSAGSLTSQAYHKRWNRKNELLADAAEKASIAAEWLGGRRYPQARLNNAWTLVMGGQFHDTMAGTATPRSYEFAWNDDVIAMNQFAGVLTNATAAIASGLNTQTKGAAVIVYNPLNIAREDVVEAHLSLPAGTEAVRVTGPDGKEVPAQVEGGSVLFLAKAPSVGYSVYDVQPAASAPGSHLVSVTESSLENARYRVTIDSHGDVSDIFDKQIKKGLLSAPIRLAISTDTPRQWPAWNMDFEDEQRAPRAYVGGLTSVRITEKGPARVAVEVSREAEGSKFVQTIRLSAGDAGNRVEFSNAVDWRTLAANVKATFPLAARNELAAYNWDIGTVQRPTENERQFEVGSHQWIDLTDQSGSFGATILTDCKNGSDKLNDHTVRLTLIRTPGLPPQEPGQRPPQGRSYSDQLNQDWGHHEFLFGIAGHAGDRRQAQTDWQAYRLNQPLIAFESSKHGGPLGKTFSLLSTSNPRVRILALKKAEMTDEVVLRMVEMDGKPAKHVQFKFAGPITAAREVNGQEQPIGSATISGGLLVTSLKPYQPRTFALKLGVPPSMLAAVSSQPVSLSYDLAVASNDDTQSMGGFDEKGNAMPAEMMPPDLSFNDVHFHIGPSQTGAANAVVAKGQTIQLPTGTFNRAYVLAASADGDQKGTFRAGGKAFEVTIQNWGGFVGQWDKRMWKEPENSPQWTVSANHAVWDLLPGARIEQRRYSPQYPEDYQGLVPGYIKRADLAWYASHYHTAEGLNEPYAYSYLFAYTIDVPANAKALTLPNNDKIRIMAISVAEETGEVRPVQPLYDTLERSPK